MTMTDRTNEEISLSMHDQVHGGVVHPAVLEVDFDSDSALRPMAWVHLALTDADHDSDTIRLTLHEAGLLHDRLGLILGRVKST